MKHEHKENEVAQNAFGETGVLLDQLGQIVQPAGHAQGAKDKEDAVAAAAVSKARAARERSETKKKKSKTKPQTAHLRYTSQPSNMASDDSRPLGHRIFGSARSDTAGRSDATKPHSIHFILIDLFYRIDSFSSLLLFNH